MEKLEAIINYVSSKMNEKSISINHKTSESLIRIQLTIWITYLKILSSIEKKL